MVRPCPVVAGLMVLLASGNWMVQAAEVTSKLVCPAVAPDTVGICVESCPQEGCPGGELCCFNGCGHVCTRGIIDDLEDECVTAHNIVRDLHVDTGKLVWDSSLAKSSQDWMESQIPSGSLGHSSGNYGENIYYSWASNASPDKPTSCAAAVFAWYNERVDPLSYDFNRPYWENWQASLIGHFTQVVWKDTTKVGCGRAYNNQYWYILCQYTTRGNFRNTGLPDQAAIDQVQPPKAGSQIPRDPQDLIDSVVIVDPEPPCYQPMEVGPCEASMPRWYYNTDSYSCEAFNYGGCDGNENNFETQDECMALCQTFDDRSPCQKLQVDSGDLVGAYIPQCTDLGEFEVLQCHGSTGQCWCVNYDGQEITGTRRNAPERPDCSNQESLFSCDFEEDLCGLSVSKDEDNKLYPWERLSGPTPSGDTGPIGGDKGSSYYVYFETSDPVPAYDGIARLSTPDMDYSGEACVSFCYSMYGEHMGTLNLIYEDSEGPRTLWTRSGDQGDLWYSANLTVTMNGESDISRLHWESSKGKAYRSDVGLDTISITEGRCDQDPTDGVKDRVMMTLTFDSETSSPIVQDSSDNWDWVWSSESSPSSGTGPQSGYGGDGDGYYYFEASDPVRTGDTARFITPALAMSGAACVKFYYSMYGQHQDTAKLSLYTQEGDSFSDDQVNYIWSETGDHGDEWVYAEQEVDIRAVNSQIGFEAMRGGGYQSDIAVDEITVTEGTCADEGDSGGRSTPRPSSTQRPTLPTQRPTTRPSSTQRPTLPTPPPTTRPSSTRRPTTRPTTRPSSTRRPTTRPTTRPSSTPPPTLRPNSTLRPTGAPNPSTTGASGTGDYTIDDQTDVFCIWTQDIWTKCTWSVSVNAFVDCHSNVNVTMNVGESGGMCIQEDSTMGTCGAVNGSICECNWDNGEKKYDHWGFCEWGENVSSLCMRDVGGWSHCTWMNGSRPLDVEAGMRRKKEMDDKGVDVRGLCTFSTGNWGYCGLGDEGMEDCHLGSQPDMGVAKFKQCNWGNGYGFFCELVNEEWVNCVNTSDSQKSQNHTLDNSRILRGDLWSQCGMDNGTSGFCGVNDAGERTCVWSSNQVKDVNKINVACGKGDWNWMLCEWGPYGWESCITSRDVDMDAMDMDEEMWTMCTTGEGTWGSCQYSEGKLGQCSWDRKDGMYMHWSQCHWDNGMTSSCKRSVGGWSDCSFMNGMRHIDTQYAMERMNEGQVAQCDFSTGTWGMCTWGEDSLGDCTIGQSEDQREATYKECHKSHGLVSKCWLVNGEWTNCVNEMDPSLAPRNGTLQGPSLAPRSDTVQGSDVKFAQCGLDNGTWGWCGEDDDGNAACHWGSHRNEDFAMTTVLCSWGYWVYSHCEWGVYGWQDCGFSVPVDSDTVMAYDEEHWGQCTIAYGNGTWGSCRATGDEIDMCHWDMDKTKKGGDKFMHRSTCYWADYVTSSCVWYNEKWNDCKFEQNLAGDADATLIPQEGERGFCSFTTGTWGNCRWNGDNVDDCYLGDRPNMTEAESVECHWGYGFSTVCQLILKNGDYVEDNCVNRTDPTFDMGMSGDDMGMSGDDMMAGDDYVGLCSLNNGTWGWCGQKDGEEGCLWGMEKDMDRRPRTVTVICAWQSSVWSICEWSTRGEWVHCEVSTDMDIEEMRMHGVEMPHAQCRSSDGMFGSCDLDGKCVWEGLDEEFMHSDTCYWLEVPGLVSDCMRTVGGWSNCSFFLDGKRVGYEISERLMGKSAICSASMGVWGICSWGDNGPECIVGLQPTPYDATSKECRRNDGRKITCQLINGEWTNCKDEPDIEFRRDTPMNTGDGYLVAQCSMNNGTWGYCGGKNWDEIDCMWGPSEDKKETMVLCNWGKMMWSKCQWGPSGWGDCEWSMDMDMDMVNNDDEHWAQCTVAAEKPIWGSCSAKGGKMGQCMWDLKGNGDTHQWSMCSFGQDITTQCYRDVGGWGPCEVWIGQRKVKIDDFNDIREMLGADGQVGTCTYSTGAWGYCRLGEKSVEGCTIGETHDRVPATHKECHWGYGFKTTCQYIDGEWGNCSNETDPSMAGDMDMKADDNMHIAMCGMNNGTWGWCHMDGDTGESGCMWGKDRYEDEKTKTVLCEWESNIWSQCEWGVYGWGDCQFHKAMENSTSTAAMAKIKNGEHYGHCAMPNGRWGTCGLVNGSMEWCLWLVDEKDEGAENNLVWNRCDFGNDTYLLCVYDEPHWKDCTWHGLDGTIINRNSSAVATATASNRSVNCVMSAGAWGYCRWVNNTINCTIGSAIGGEPWKYIDFGNGRHQTCEFSDGNWDKCSGTIDDMDPLGDRDDDMDPPKAADNNDDDRDKADRIDIIDGNTNDMPFIRAENGRDSSKEWGIVVMWNGTWGWCNKDNNQCIFGYTEAYEDKGNNSVIRVHPMITFVQSDRPARLWCSVMDRNAVDAYTDIMWFFPNGTQVKDTPTRGYTPTRFVINRYYSRDTKEHISSLFVVSNDVALSGEYTCVASYNGKTVKAGAGVMIQGCTDKHFMCHDKSCIPKAWHCDGRMDCEDMSDEMDC